jgi:hypothetical protein
MTMRIVQVLGMAFGSSPAEITVTANGTQVFSGTVTTVDQPLPNTPDPAIIADQVPLFTFEIPIDFAGQIPMVCTVNKEAVIFGQVLANYTVIRNSVYSDEQIATLNDPSTTRTQMFEIWNPVANPPFTPEEAAVVQDTSLPWATVQTVLYAHNCATTTSSGSAFYADIDTTDARNDVAIDGVVQEPDHGELPGTWWWLIDEGSVLSYNLDVAAGLE